VRVSETDENPARRRPMSRWLVRAGLARALLLVTGALVCAYAGVAAAPSSAE